jgi:hypothetical protein
MLKRLPGLGTSIDEVMRQPEGESVEKNSANRSTS